MIRHLIVPDWLITRGHDVIARCNFFLLLSHDFTGLPDSFFQAERAVCQISTFITKRLDIVPDNCLAKS